MWDEQNPVHFVGHSAGAQVVRVLHQMLADKVYTSDAVRNSHANHMLPRDGSCDLEYMIRAPNFGLLCFSFS